MSGVLADELGKVPPNAEAVAVTHLVRGRMRAQRVIVVRIFSFPTRIDSATIVTSQSMSSSAIQEEIVDAEGDFQGALDAQHDEDDEGEEGGDESLSLADAALIWRSRGMDEDYTLGYPEDELRQEM